MASQDYHLAGADQSGGLGFHRERELDRQYAPLVIGNVVLLNRVNSARAFIATENINVTILKHYRWHSASLLIKVRDPLPPIHVYGIPLAALEHSVNGSTSNRVNKVPLVRESVGISALVQLGLLRADLVLGIVHEDRSRNVGETRVETTGNKDVTICKTDGDRIALKAEVVGHLEKMVKIEERLTSFLVQRSLAKS
jgi:hypothetical protein